MNDRRDGIRCGSSDKQEKLRCLEDSHSSQHDQDRGVENRIVELLSIGNTESTVALDVPIFAPRPSQVVFRNFEGLQTYTATLWLRNQDSVVRRVTVVPPDTTLFQVKRNRAKSGANMDKVAPGMEISYTVSFMPQGKADQAYDLSIITERERFVVPIRAIGGEAVMDFPETIDFASAPVKFKAEKTVLLRNIGDKPTSFILSVRPPFDLSVHEGYLDVNDSLQVTVWFRPLRAEAYERVISLQCDSGLRLTSRVRGRGDNADVQFSHRQLLMDTTYVALTSQRRVKIHNNTDVSIDFVWKGFSCAEEDHEQKKQADRPEGIQANMTDSTGFNADYSGSEFMMDTISTDILSQPPSGTHLRPLPCRNAHTFAKEDKMLFCDEIFSIEPLTGRIWVGRPSKPICL
eukprot:GHVS01015412.1.p1 GENE.GHVS01015412.1~~GHVS01015412.1.p1  ORF type:complete len:404 (+),score=39.73 GHVS01015412.1:134-1345(+)